MTGAEKIGITAGNAIGVRHIGNVIIEVSRSWIRDVLDDRPVLQPRWTLSKDEDGALHTRRSSWYQGHVNGLEYAAGFTILAWRRLVSGPARGDMVKGSIPSTLLRDHAIRRD